MPMSAGLAVSATGAILTGDFRISPSLEPGGQETPSVAFNGVNYFVAWRYVESTALARRFIQGVRVTTSGSIIDTGSLLLSSNPGTGVEAPDVAARGTDVLVVWQELRSGTGFDVSATR